MSVTVEARSLAARVQPPASREVRAALTDYLERTGHTHMEFAARIGYSQQAVSMFLYGRYAKLAGTDLYLRAAVWDYIERHPVVVRRAARGRLFATENVQRIRRYFARAIAHGEVALLYGPPGTQKTFALEHLIAEQNGRDAGAALYVYASDRMTALALLRRIGRAAGAVISSASVERLITNVLAALETRSQAPAILVDEAQHLDVRCLEILRELHDRSGCGLVLAGSHSLFENFLRGRAHLEQWLSRIDHKDPLPGLTEDEVERIAARELGNGQPAKLSERQVRELVKMCRVEDVFARDPEGKRATRQYLSVRRLVKSIAQLKEQRCAAHSANAKAGAA